jgi:hypothetical protein
MPAAPVAPIFRKAHGLNNKVNPVRLAEGVDPKESVDLAAAVNIEIDNTGRISRRKGYTKVLDVQAEDIFCDGWSCLFREGDTLYNLHNDYTASAIYTPLTSGLRLYYTTVGAEIYFSNGVEKAIFNCMVGLARTWEAGEYVGPATSREMIETPAGTHLALYRARLYLAQGSLVLYTEPFAYAWVDMTRNFIQLPAAVTAIMPVNDGIFFSTEKGIYFYAGMLPEEFMPRKVFDHPVIDGSQVKTTIGKLSGNESDDTAWVFMTEKGVCICKAEGIVFNMTESKLVYPRGGRFGAGVIINDRYLGFIQS